MASDVSELEDTMTSDVSDVPPEGCEALTGNLLRNGSFDGGASTSWAPRFSTLEVEAEGFCGEGLRITLDAGESYGGVNQDTNVLGLFSTDDVLMARVHVRTVTGEGRLAVQFSWNFIDESTGARGTQSDFLLSRPSEGGWSVIEGELMVPDPPESGQVLQTIAFTIVTQEGQDFIVDEASLVPEP